MFQELDIVKLKRDLVDIKDSTDEIVTIPAGTYGTVLIVYNETFGFKARDPLDYEVEFLDEEGHTLGLLPVSEPDLEFDSSYEQRKAAASARSDSPPSSPN
ncbi:MAG: DUF4926 domain-containing protein [Candidatus Obscuribacterales bacterium]|nr:DUF4926 domain-containing protein [Candidatus Obscuribacterales bacterium]